MYQNCISSKPIGSVWKIKHDHSDNSGPSLTSVRIRLYIDVKFRFLFYLKHSFLRTNDKSFERKLQDLYGYIQRTAFPQEADCLATWSTWKGCEWTWVCLGFLLIRKAFSARAKDQYNWDYSDTSGAETNKITLMSRCFFRDLETPDITFLPEGLFDNLINLELLWVNTSLFSLSN